LHAAYQLVNELVPWDVFRRVDQELIVIFVVARLGLFVYDARLGSLLVFFPLRPKATLRILFELLEWRAESSTHVRHADRTQITTKVQVAGVLAFDRAHFCRIMLTRGARAGYLRIHHVHSPASLQEIASVQVDCLRRILQQIGGIHPHVRRTVHALGALRLQRSLISKFVGHALSSSERSGIASL